MSTRSQCPYCGTVVSIYEKALGLSLKCPSCDRSFEARVFEPNEAEPLAPPIVATSGEGQPEEEAPRPKKAIIFRKDRKSLEAEMDMTPMVDVTFQLLIFFMLTASFTMQKSLNVPKPESTEPSTQAKSLQDFQENPDYVVVRVDENGTYYVTAAAWQDEIEAPAAQDLRVRLREARQGDSQGNVPSKMLVFANGEALHERVVTAIDAGNEVGMDEVQLVTVEGDEAF